MVRRFLFSMTKLNSCIFILLIATMVACKGRRYKVPGGAMEKTIRANQTVYVANTSIFQRNDIACFEIYADDYSRPTHSEERPFGYEKSWQRWIKRIIAVSGDVLLIKDGDVFLDDKPIPLPPLALEEYAVYTSMIIEEFGEDDGFSSFMPETRGDTIIYRRFLTTAEVEDFRNRKPAYIGVKKIIRSYEPGDIFITKPKADLQWSIDNYGPLRLPQPGDTVMVDESSYKLYQNIPGIQMGKNVIKEQLYFMMGDNRHGSADSRFIGLISHSKMKGIVKL